MIKSTVNIASWRYLFTTFKLQKQCHYQVLGVQPNATASQIKQKYYELAKLYHPDVCKDQDSSSKFAQITIAYEVLNDETKRRDYDSQRPSQKSTSKKQDKFTGFQSRYRSHKQKQAKNEEDEDPFTAYDEYFKKNRSYLKPKRGTDVNINLTISLQESILGVRKQVFYTQQQICETCQSTEKQQCYACGGKRQIFNRIKRQKQQCGNCGGKGYVNECSACLGSSYVKKDVKQSIYISKNTHNKSILRVEGLGNHGFKSSNGDLYITVLVQDSAQFKIDGNNIHSQHQLDYLTAIFGGNVKIKTVYGWENIDLEPGTQSGHEMRLFNLGLTSQYSRRKGDHIVKFRIKVPEVLTEKQKRLLQQLNIG